MIEERAIVSRIAGDQLWVRPFGAESCPQCARGEGCGGGLLARLAGRRRPEVAVQGTASGLAVGQGVVVGIDEAAIWRASLWLYAAPLGLMLVGALLAEQWLGAGEPGIVGGAAAGLAAGVVAARSASARAQGASRYRVTLLRREDARGGDCAASTNLYDKAL